MSSHDELTGLATRAAMLEWLGHAQAVRSGTAGGAGDKQAVLALVDLEGFAGVNAEFGEAHGDEVLRTVARRLQEIAGRCGLAARVGGDAFVVAVRRPGTSALELGNQVIRAVGGAVELDARRAFVTGNVAVAVAAWNEGVPSIVRRLELALDRARRAGGQAVVIADALEEDRFNAALAADLHDALERDAVGVHYVPVVELATATITTFDAQVHWLHGDHMLRDQELVELGTSVGLLPAIGRAALEAACVDVGDWTARHPDGPTLGVSVPASVHQFDAPTALNDLRALLETSGLRPDQLCLALGEDSLRDVGELQRSTLAALKELGVRLAVTDFATSGSSVLALREHGIDELRISAALIDEMDRTDGGAAMVRGVTRLAHALGLDVVAEGVERPGQEQMLRSLGCTAAHGPLYSTGGVELDDVLSGAEKALLACAQRKPPEHDELWHGVATPSSAARFVESVFETAPIGMVMIDPTGRHLAVNPAAAALFGQPPARLIGTSCWERVHPADLQADLAGMDALVRGEETSYVVAERILGAGGTMRWVEVTVSGVPADDHAHGQPIRLFRQMRSIDEQRRVQTEAAMLRAAMRSWPEAVITVDASAQCLQWNAACERLFGWSEADMVGAPLSRLVEADSQLQLARVVGEAAAGDVVHWADATWRSASGDARPVHVIVGPIRDAEGLVTGLVVLARDVADQRAADAALREAHAALRSRADELIEANDRLATFAGTLSHDLLQPVAALDGFLTLLAERASELDDEHRTWLEAAIRGKDRIATAIDALHRDALADELPLEPVALTEVVAPLIAELVGDVTIEAGELPVVLGDPELFTQVMANLFQNALRYRAPDQPLRVVLDAQVDGEWCILSVTDNGRGIAPDEVKVVFKRGVRGRSSTGTSGSGTGLATVRSLMRHMGGDAWAEAHDGGARICLRARVAAEATDS